VPSRLMVEQVVRITPHMRIQFSQRISNLATAPGTFGLTISRSGTGSGTVTSTPAGISCGSTCNASYTDGTSVTLTANPATGSTFSGWSGACSGTGSCTVTMSADQIVIADFAGSGTGGGTTGGSQTTYTVNVTSAGDFDVTDLMLNAGDKITFVYTPPILGELKIRFSPSTIGSVTLDQQFTHRSKTFNTAGTWTFKVSGKNGNQGTVVVQ
jgi:plastocyanin